MLSLSPHMESVANYAAFYKVHKLKPIVNIKSFDIQKQTGQIHRKYISNLTVKYCMQFLM